MLEWAEANWFWLGPVVVAVLGLLGTIMEKKWGAGYAEWAKYLAGHIEKAKANERTAFELVQELKDGKAGLSKLAQGAMEHVVNQVDDKKEPESGGKRFWKTMGRIGLGLLFRR